MSNDETSRGYPLPSPDNIAYEDARRIREAIVLISDDVAALDEREATEDHRGNVRLATAAEAAAGTSNNRVATIKRTKDMITSALNVIAQAMTTLQETVAEQLADTEADVDQAISDLTQSVQSQLSSISGKVAKAGDTMSGNLSFDKAAGASIEIRGKIAGKDRWVVALGDGSAEAGANAGSNFALGRFTDAGALIDSVLSVNRASGLVTVGAGGLSVNSAIKALTGSLWTYSGSAGGYVYFTSAGSVYLGWNGSYLVSNQWLLSPNGNRYAAINELANGNVISIRAVYYTDYGIYQDGGWREANPSWITSLRFEPSEGVYYARYRYLQYLVNGSWINLTWTS